MKQNEVSKWLKGISIAIAIMGLIFFGVLVPRIALECKASYPEVDFLFWPGLIGTWIVGGFGYAILYQFWSVCVQIGKDNSFSMENAKSFACICKIAVVNTILLFGSMLFVGFHSWLNPGFLLLFIGIIFISITIAVLAAALSHLILKAYEMKTENDLTI